MDVRRFWTCAKKKEEVAKRNKNVFRQLVAVMVMAVVSWRWMPNAIGVWFILAITIR
jgi:hypothetical protein